MTPSEFKQLKDLRLVDDQGLKSEMLMLLEADTESVSVLLSQLKSYILGDIENSLNPVGSPIPWPNDNIPTGYAKINNGLTFDIIKFPRTALAWPSGVIPPHKGLVIECTADGAVTGKTETGEIKEHAHAAEIKKISLSGRFGSDKSSVTGSATLDIPVRSGDDSNQVVSPAWCGDIINKGSRATATINTSDLSVTTSTNVSFNNVDVTPQINNTGISRNTVDRINYNMIVRLA